MLGCVSMRSQSGWRPTRRTSTCSPRDALSGSSGGLLTMKMFLRIVLFLSTVSTGISPSSSSPFARFSESILCVSFSGFSMIVAEFGFEGVSKY